MISWKPQSLWQGALKLRRQGSGPPTPRHSPARSFYLRAGQYERGNRRNWYCNYWYIYIYIYQSVILYLYLLIRGIVNYWILLIAINTCATNLLDVECQDFPSLKTPAYFYCLFRRCNHTGIQLYSTMFLNNILQTYMGARLLSFAVVAHRLVLVVSISLLQHWQLGA